MISKRVKKAKYVEEFKYYSITLDGLIVTVKNNVVLFADKKVELCDLDFNGKIILNNNAFVDEVEQELQNFYVSSYADGTYILSGNVDVYVNADGVDSLDLINIILVPTVSDDVAEEE